MSIDLFFFFSPFLASNRQELLSLAKRLALAPVLASAGFLAFPLTLAFRPEKVDGLFGPIFDFLFSFDQPHNLLPSLHVCYTLILQRMYGRHTSGILRWACHVWFTLVIASTLLTHQHHVLDVVGGAWLGALIFYLVPDTIAGQETFISRTRHVDWRLGTRYVVGALACLSIGFWTKSWGLLLLWPALSLGLVGAAYIGLGPAVFRKRGGRVHFSAKVILGPYLLGLYLSRLPYWRGLHAYDAVGDSVLMGRTLSAKEARRVVENGVAAVVDLTAEHDEAAPFTKLPYRNVQILDLTLPCQDNIMQAVAFMRDHERGGKIYLHCALGYGRSAAVSAAYLLATGSAKTVGEARTLIQQARPQAVFTDEVCRVVYEIAVEAGWAREAAVGD